MSSKRSLIEKLGIKDGFKIIFLNTPEDYDKTLGKLPKGVFVSETLKGPLDFIQFFTKKKEELEKEFPILNQELSRNGMLWVSWPKVSSGVKTDLNETVVREIGLENGLVDVKVVAVDKTWSGLKFVCRLRNKPLIRV
jgi:hypothetical protein